MPVNKPEDYDATLFTSTPITNPPKPTANVARENSRKRQGSLLRTRSLTRPDRQRPRPPLFHHDMPPTQRTKMDMAKHSKPLPPTPVQTSNMTWWSIIANVATCCFPSWFLSYCFKKHNPLVRQAWREKVTLVYIIIFCSVGLAYLTFGLKLTLCPEQRQTYAYSTVYNGSFVKAYRTNVTVHGMVYPYETMHRYLATKGLNLTKEFQGVDLSWIFDADTSGACKIYDAGRSGATSTLGSCIINGPYGGILRTSNGNCLPLRDLLMNLKSTAVLSYDWTDFQPDGVNKLRDSPLVLLGENVLNVTLYINTGIKFYGVNTHNALLQSLGNDGSLALSNWDNAKQAQNCLLARYRVGVIQTETGGCIASNLVMDIMLGIIITLICVRYSMAIVFRWCIAGRIVRPGGRSGLISWQRRNGNNNSVNLQSYQTPSSFRSSLSQPTQVMEPNMEGPSKDLYTVMLVTCYSEGIHSIKTTMDSLAETHYSRRHKLFIVIADGLITGSGESQSTPDMVLSMMDLDPLSVNPKPCYYQAIADGEKQLNRAKVYAGTYKHQRYPTPCLLIVKCGTPAEEGTSKPGNRGKRDSQLILMTFFQHILFNDRLTELHYEMFWKITSLMNGVTPDKFEVVLMIDADTKVMSDSLSYMVEAMKNDPTIMGLCGETCIANKAQSWVTAIQVFEYHISHHYAKAFESFFGGVTCLPGCFSMYRIKAPKNGAWVPILASPDIILEYNLNVVTTLHAKNLLLLGEDRFLSTLMLRTFPRRQMIFVPQARCKTVVPDKFSVLLSQRRRWINSTVHNLMELVLVSDLCGIACLSMQFSVLIDLIGTVVLPAAIVMSFWLIVSSAVSSTPQWQPIIFLLSILGLPVVLIIVTLRKFVYILWMIAYILALPIWNLVLPLYAFWHFDDFSWGATRVVEGEVKGSGHDDDEKGQFDSSQLSIKHLNEWEVERTGRSTYAKPRVVRSYYSNRNLMTYDPADRYSFHVASPTPSVSPVPRPMSASAIPNIYQTPNQSSRSNIYLSSPPASSFEIRQSFIKSLQASSTNTYVESTKRGMSSISKGQSSTNSSTVSRTSDNDSSTIVL
ncbi:chitin synthase [Umbelopsis sp. PMI_123]|nr:chitin synthase [Umbelopsis sp. PMI_123]